MTQVVTADNTANKASSFTLSVAPMMSYTDRHYRHLMRFFCKKTTLYTEMVAINSILNAREPRNLDLGQDEPGVVLQVGGSSPSKIVTAMGRIRTDHYQAINFNVGCPSKRRGDSRLGARLMLEPNLVAECIEALVSSCDCPVSVKTRIGVDDIHDFDFLYNLVQKVLVAGSDKVIIHARVALLSGINPEQNRNIPPLNYERVREIKQAFPDEHFEINGGIDTIDGALSHQNSVDGVMIGRKAYSDPLFMRDLEQVLYPGQAYYDRSEIIDNYGDYVLEKLGINPHYCLLKHLYCFVGESEKARLLINSLMASSNPSQNEVQQVIQRVKECATEHPNAHWARYKDQGAMCAN